MAYDDYTTKSRLKEQGWTDGMIKKLLGEPDTTKPNPMYKSAAPMALYLVTRVQKVEASEAFREAKEKSAGRKASAQKAVKTKLEKALDYARTVVINVPAINYEKVVKRACQSYNEWHEYDRYGRYNEYFTPADPLNSDKDFLQRITINYLRHECSSYEQQLYKLYGKTGVNEAHDILQKRINDEIQRIYPQLKQ